MPRLLAPRQQVPFDAAVHEVVEHLVGGDGAAARQGGRFFHLVGVEIADAIVEDLSGLLERGKCFERLRERLRAAPVQQIEVEAVGLEPLEAALAGRDDAAPRGVVRIDLADQAHLVAPARDRLGDDLLGAAFAVHLGGVDQGDAEIEPELQRGDLGVERAAPARPCPRCPGRAPASRDRREGAAT